MEPSVTHRLREYLSAVAQLLEGGDAVAAAAEMEKIHALYPSLPSSMPADELAEVRQLFDRCTAAERALSQSLVESRQRLSMAHRVQVYGR